MMQSGFRDRNGERIAGHPRDAREAAPQAPGRARALRPRRRLRRHRPGAARRRRHGAPRHRRAGPRGRASRGDAAPPGDHRRRSASERNMQLDMLPPDLAGQVRELQDYDFTSSEARERFEQLIDQLRQQLMQSYFNQMAGRHAGHVARGHAAHEGHDRRRSTRCSSSASAARTPRASSSSWSSFGDFFPENPQTLDELLELMAQRMAAMQAMLNSMTPEQRAQLQGLAEQLLEDMDLRWQMDQLGAEPAARCSRRWAGTGATTSAARTRSGFAEAAAADATSSATSTSSRTCCAAPPTRARWPRSTSTGPATCSATTPPASLERLAELAKMLEEAGLIEQQGGPLRADADGACARSASNALRDLFQQAGQGQDRPAPGRPHRRRPRARLRDQALRVRRPVQPRHRAHHPQRHPAQRRRHAGAAVARRLRDRAHRAPRPGRRTVLMLDLSLSMPMRDNFLAAKKVAMALHSLISIAVPARLPRHRRLQRGGPRAQARAAARGVVGLRLRHEHAARLPARPPAAGPADAARSRSS